MNSDSREMMPGQWAANDVHEVPEFALQFGSLFQNLRSVSTCKGTTAVTEMDERWLLCLWLGNMLRYRRKRASNFPPTFRPGAHARTPRHATPRASTLCRKKQQFRCGFCLFSSSVRRPSIQTMSPPLVVKRVLLASDRDPLALS